MKLSAIVIVTLCATALPSGKAHFWNNNYPIPVYQQGSQFNLPGQASYYYQPGVPLPNNVQQLFPQPGQVPFNYQPGVPINIQQLTQLGYTSPLQQTNIPLGIQQNGIPFNTQQASFPVNQQFIPQIGNVGAPGPIQFPR